MPNNKSPRAAAHGKRTKSQKHQTTVSLPVELTFEHWPALSHEGLPAMVDIQQISLTIVGPGGQPRTIDITKTFSEDQIMLLEDEILDQGS